MIIGIRRETLSQINNPTFSAYASIYVDIYEDFLEQIKTTGIEIDPKNYDDEIVLRYDRLRDKGAMFRNDDRSIYINEISPACIACRSGIGSATFFISLQCHRSCFYCFNPNQENYVYFTQHQRKLTDELDQIHTNGQKVDHLALTGGEPLVHPDQAIQFFTHAGEKFPSAYKRLYTCGDHANEDIMEELRNAGLEEIRFSIRIPDLEQGNWHTFDKIKLAKDTIPYVMVEMPVLPDTFEIMKEVLLRLEELEIYSINLLEFCYPFINTDIFNQKGYMIKNRPYKVLYNYWYAGGLPVSQSDLVCLDLMEFAIDEKLNIGVHYCSLENKHTGQIHQQNKNQKLSKRAYFSERDYFIKTAKVFGGDIPHVLKIFKKIGYDEYIEDMDHDFLEFHVNLISSLKELPIEVGISTNVNEVRDEGNVLRDLKIDLTYPEHFDMSTDV